MKTEQEIEHRIQGLQKLENEYKNEWEKNTDLGSRDIAELLQQRKEELEWVLGRKTI